MSHFDNAITHFENLQNEAIQFGTEAWQAVETEQRTIRELSVKLCGDESLEDVIGRYIMAAKWNSLILHHRQYAPLYEDMRAWLTHSHLTECWKNLEAFDEETALDWFEQCFIRNVAGTVVKVKPVDWLRSKRATDYSPAEVFHRFWKWGSKAYNDAWSELERKGLDATKRDRRRVRIAALVLAEFSAESETA